MGNTNINCITNYSNKVKILIEVVQCIWLYYPLDIFCSRLYIALQFCVSVCIPRHSDSADPNVSKTSRRSEIQEKQDGPKHSERHQERN